MEEEIGLASLLERRPEAGDQSVGKIANEANGVGEEDRAPAVELPTARARIEGGEELVGRQDVGARQPIQQRALAGIGVADEGDGHVVLAGLHLPLFPAVDLGDFGAEIVDPLLDEPAIDLELFLARPTHADPHLEARQMGPQLLEPRQRILQLRQLHRQAGLVGAGPRGEDVEDHLGAVKNLRLQLLLEVADLGRREVVVEDHDVGVVVGDEPGQLRHLPLAEIGRLIGALTPLRHLGDDLRPG